MNQRIVVFYILLLLEKKEDLISFLQELSPSRHVVFFTRLLVVGPHYLILLFHRSKKLYITACGKQRCSMG